MKITSKLENVSARIQAFERTYLSSKEISRFEKGQWVTIHPEEGIRIPVYRATPPAQLYDNLNRFVKVTKNVLSNIKAAVCGSGLGASSTALSYYCKSVTGYELFPSFIKDARTVVREFGYRNIKFKNGDFIKADLSKFKLWYIYYPFFQDFGRTIEKKVKEASSGTLIILRSEIPQKLLSMRDVEQIYPLDHKAFMKADFSVIRKS